MKELYLGVAYDAMREMGYKYDDFYINIKPKAGYKDKKCIQGYAFTTIGYVIKPILGKMINYEYFDRIRLEIYKKNLTNKIVLLQANDNKVAHSGDITSLIYKKLGAEGFITDGNVRDIDLINEIDFPVFCKDSNPIDAIDYWAIIDFQSTINIDNVVISPDDYIIASNDGVIVVPKNSLNVFKTKIFNILNKENKIRDKIIKSEDNLFDILNELFCEDGRW